MANRRYQILDAIQTELEGVSVANGYHTNVGSNVYIHKSDPWNENILPGLNIIRRANTHENEFAISGGNISQQILNVEVHLVCQPGATDYQTAENIVSDIYKALGVDGTWGGLAIETIPTDDEILIIKHPDSDTVENVIAGGMVAVQIRYRTDKWGEDLT